MNFVTNQALICPLDAQPLDLVDGCLKCAANHSFDIASRGYVNLLAAADKRSRDPGDSKAMIAARRDFLAAGHYAPVAEKLAELVVPLVTSESFIVDAGCGEGYYLARLQQVLARDYQCHPAFLGFDISKWAMQAAAKKFPATWLVASNRHIPVADQSVDVLLGVFGFSSYESFRRILKPSGKLLLVSAGPNHLLELRKVIYPEVKVSGSTELEQALDAGFTLVNDSTLTFQTEPLSQDKLAMLLGMTPHLFRASAEGKRRAMLLDQFELTVDISFQLFESTLV
ncbi:MAG: methyltransferase domain-containing protein [Halioglobus sp.]